MKRILIVGSPRSGTTLLQRLLADHKDLTSFPETHLLWALVGGSRIRRRFGIVNPRTGKERMVAFLQEAGIDTDRNVRSLCAQRSLRLSVWLRWMCDLFDQVAHERGADGWIEKTPRHLQYLEAIVERIVDLHVVHILRPGEDTIASVVEVTRLHAEDWGHQVSLDAAAERWLLDVSLHRRWVGQPHHVFVHFDDLVGRPSEVLGYVLAMLQLELEFCEQQRSYPDFGNASSGEPACSGQLAVRPKACQKPLITGRETWKAAALTPISKTATTSASKRLSEQDLNRLRSMVGTVDIRDITGRI